MSVTRKTDKAGKWDGALRDTVSDSDEQEGSL
jgi:hypothetical protein